MQFTMQTVDYHHKWTWTNIFCTNKNPKTLVVSHEGRTWMHHTIWSEIDVLKIFPPPPCKRTICSDSVVRWGNNHVMVTWQVGSSVKCCQKWYKKAVLILKKKISVWTYILNHNLENSLANIDTVWSFGGQTTSPLWKVVHCHACSRCQQSL